MKEVPSDTNSIIIFFSLFLILFFFRKTVSSFLMTISLIFSLFMLRKVSELLPEMRTLSKRNLVFLFTCRVFGFVAGTTSCWILSVFGTRFAKSSHEIAVLGVPSIIGDEEHRGENDATWTRGWRMPHDLNFCFWFVRCFRYGIHAILVKRRQWVGVKLQRTNFRHWTVRAALRIDRKRETRERRNWPFRRGC